MSLPLKVGFIISFVLLTLDLAGAMGLTWLQILLPLGIGLVISVVITWLMIWAIWMR